MEKTNSEPLQEAKTAAAAGREEKQNAGGTPKADPVKLTFAVIAAVIGILSLEIPWLVNHPSILKLALLLAAAISGGLFFGFGLNTPDEHENDKTGNDDISGWLFAVFYLFACISAGLIYYFCPGSRINAWLYALIDLVQSVVVGLLGFIFTYFSCLLAGDPESARARRAGVIGMMLTVAAAAGMICWGWTCLQNNSSPLLAMLLPVIIAAGSILAGWVGILVVFPAAAVGFMQGLGSAIMRR